MPPIDHPATPLNPQLPATEVPPLGLTAAILRWMRKGDRTHPAITDDMLATAEQEVQVAQHPGTQMTTEHHKALLDHYNTVNRILSIP